MSRVGFTFLWKIENFSFLSKLPKQEAICSPIFIADNLNKTSWILQLHPVGHSDNNADKFLFQLSKNSETGPNCISLDYELSILSKAHSKVKSVVARKFWFHQGNSDGTPLFIAPDEINSKREILPGDTLTVQCKMWHHENKWNLEPGFSLARTQIDVERKYITLTINNFSILQADYTKTVSVLNFSKKQVYLILTFSFSLGKIRIKVEGETDGKESILLLGISVQDANHKSVQDFLNEFPVRKERKECWFPLNISREKLMEDKDLLLPGDVLSLKCDLAVYDIVLNRNEISGFGGSSISDLEAALTNTNRSLCLGKRKRHAGVNSLTKDLRYLFEEKQHTDLSLRVNNEIFSVHKALLAARSSVFKAMFDTDMKEKLTNTIEINDIEVDTMRRLLLYIYCDTLDSDIQWENACSLYLAAEKYAVVGLKEECSTYLKANLSISNACETLVLADVLGDKDLNDFVLTFIQDKDQAVLNSDEWKHFEQAHPQLTINALTRLYKNIKNF